MARILVVDDDEAFLDLIVEHLKSRGHEVSGCVDPERASALARDFRPQLAVLDYVMPRMTGTDLMIVLRERHADLAVVFLSGVESLRYSQLVPPDKRVRFLHKPVELKVLEGAISVMLDPEGWSRG